MHVYIYFLLCFCYLDRCTIFEYTRNQGNYVSFSSQNVSLNISLKIMHKFLLCNISLALNNIKKYHEKLKIIKFVNNTLYKILISLYFLKFKY